MKTNVLEYLKHQHCQFRLSEHVLSSAYPVIAQIMEEYAELSNNQANDAERSSDKCHIHDVISRFFKEMAEKHNVKVDDLNLHISYNQLYIQEYTPNQRNEFKCLEIVDLNGL